MGFPAGTIARARFAGAAHAAEKKIGVALYGSNGPPDQSSEARAEHPHAALVAVAGIRQTTLPAGAKRVETLDALLAVPDREG